MKLNGKHKIYAGAAAAAAVAFLLDKTVLAPAGAQAQSPAAPALAVPVDRNTDLHVTSTPLPDAAPSARSVIANRLELAAVRGNLDPMLVSDAFRPSALWMPEQAAPVVELDAPRDSSADRFIRSHELNAVMAGRGTSFALVDGRTLLLGQTLDGYTLVAVTENSATFENEKGRIELMLDPESR